MLALERPEINPTVLAVESTEGISEIWLCEPFPRWGFLRFRVRVRLTYLWLRVYPELIRNPALVQFWIRRVRQ